ncbi:penicillin-binding transpeptidase domain-containing protein [Streptomyces sp. NPDC050504]|uniref:penicillin-binding transpeptidase domain-containing protein n=1 Tax=Streptomyces sp. NPDC050504 TaxID=3365618 RepID=UPI0037B05D28
MRSGAKVAVVGAVFLVAAGGTVYGAYSLVGGDDGTSVEGKSASGKKKTGPPDPTEIRETAAEFLAAWAKGDAPAAAELTNNAAEAGPALAGYATEAHVSRAAITPGAPVGAKVPFTVKATVSYQGASKPWSYASSLTVVRGLSTGKALVDWQPAVVHPKLTKGTSLRTGEAGTPQIKAVDRGGQELTKEKFPSIGTILDGLRQKYGSEAGGRAGIELQITGESDAVPDQTLLTLTKGTPGRVPTTIDANVQAAAERAVKRFKQASVVAIQPSTGEIRAVANNPATGFNAAMQGKQAPGSTMKIVTAAMMMEHDIAGPDSKVECPSTVTWEGVPFRNLDSFSIPSGTLTDSFRRSCNTAFIKAIGPLNEKGLANTALGSTALKYFGIGADWKTGVVSSDGSVPESSGGETAASYIGQGKITMNALNMASITATAKNGGFKQPVIVPQSLDDRELATAEPLPGRISDGLRRLMRAAAGPGGTGQQAMSSVGGDKGAKTGSAEVDGQSSSNSWFTGYSNDLAAAAVVQAGGHGGDAAGPVVAEVLRSGN